MAFETGILWRLIATATDAERATAALTALNVPPALDGGGEVASRRQVAMALNVLLFADLLTRVPTAAAYVAQVVARGEAIHFDHGALRTIDGLTGALPSGTSAFARLLEPLGYEVGGVYPLPRLKMTGRAFVHRDLPEDIPQFFVSELHLTELPEEVREAAFRVFGHSTDPLGQTEHEMLDMLSQDGECPMALAIAGLPGLAAAFARHHPEPALDDYETLLAASAEAAWIATEGNAFNHATDRVPDVVALATALREAGWPLKPEVEVSASGRVRQTAFRADPVSRVFRLPDGGTVVREVPGSFYEFIGRDIDPATGAIDLHFDSANATGIFAMTREK
jgi:hypothetical protein